MTPSALRKKLRTLEGRRVDSQYTYACVYCGAQDGVLRQHWCKDELELFCDRCERWTGERISIDDLARWMRSNTVLPVVVALPARARSQVEAE